MPKATDNRESGAKATGDEPPQRSVIGLFVDLRAADAAARGLIALGLSEDQIEIVDLTRLIAEYSPEFAQKAGIGATSPDKIQLDEATVESLARDIANAVDLAQYLVKLGVPRNAASYYAGEIRGGFVLLVATPAEELVSEATRLLDKAGIGDVRTARSRAQGLPGEK
ncbi:MAG: hypothetical protein R3245_09955 [Kiloniellales bacterium]|nr:hypothetical protein [Kiloniellales bacterium]